MARTHTVVVLGALLLAITPLAANAKLASAGAAEASFTAAGPAGMQIAGTTHDVSVSEGDSVVVDVKLVQLTTGIELRDRHMRDKYLQVGTYPDAQLTVPRSALRVPGAAGNTVDATAVATLTMHGRSRQESVHYTAAREGEVLHVQGTARVDMRDYSIEAPVYLGLKVKPQVDLAVRFDAIDKSP